LRSTLATGTPVFELITRPPIEEFVRGRITIMRRARKVIMVIFVVREVGCV
jgi:hypothetical protein